MEFGNALLLVAVVTAATGFAKKVLPGGLLGGWRTQVLSLGIAIGSVWLVGETVWAGKQLIDGQALDSLGAADKVVVGLLIGFGANVFDRLTKSVSTIGENPSAYVDEAPEA